MRRLTMLFLGSVVAVAGTGCGFSDKDPSYYASGTSAEQRSGQDVTDNVTRARAETNLRLTLGDEADLTGDEPGRALQITAFEVTPIKVIGHKVPAGSRVIGVQFLVSNTGTTTYNNTPASGALIYDGRGRAYQPIDGPLRVKSGEAFKTPLRLAPRDQATGYVGFVVPEHVAIKSVRFGIDQGKGAAAMWRVV